MNKLESWIQKVVASVIISHPRVPGSNLSTQKHKIENITQYEYLTHNLCTLRHI